MLIITDEKGATGHAPFTTMAAKPEGISRVQFAFQPGGPYPSHCGYCHNETDSFVVDGLWAEDMTVHDFQDLVDRGCQRSGKFVYLPCNDKTCCPQYVMRLDSTTFRISKQQRRVVRRFAEYLKTGTINGIRPDESPGTDAVVDSVEDDSSTSPATAQASGQPPPIVEDITARPTPREKPKKKFKPGSGPDPSLPPCRKAKVVRKEKKNKREQSKTSIDSNKHGGLASSSPMDIQQHGAASIQKQASDMALEIQLPELDQCKHKFSVKLVCVNPTSKEFEDTFDQSYAVFRKFQMGIHKEPEDKCQPHHFTQFCVDSPLILEQSKIPGVQYGSFHQQYWIDDTLVMVGVLDFLPQGVLCNYLYYDPIYRFLAPGVFSALYEITQTQSYSKVDPLMQHYFMGYYVHDCPKMNYKRFYDSSYILCPETYRYIALGDCRLKLDKSKYCRLADTDTVVVIPQETNPGDSGSSGEGDDATTTGDDDVCGEVLVYNNPYSVIMKYKEYARHRGSYNNELVRLYTKMVGTELAHRMVLYFYGLVPMM